MSNNTLELGVKLRLEAEPPSELNVHSVFPSPLIIHFTQYGQWFPKGLNEWLRFEVEFIPAGVGKSWPYDDNNYVAVKHVSYVEVHAGTNSVEFKALSASVPGTYQLRVSVYIETLEKVRKRRRGCLISRPIHVAPSKSV